MDAQLETLTVNDVEYVKKTDAPKAAKNLEGLEYVIIRTYSAGVFAGFLKSRNGKEVELLKARRLWFWDGAASLSQLCMEGTKAPHNCKFPCEVEKALLPEAIEILQCTDVAMESIRGVKIWKNKLRCRLRLRFRFR